MPLYCLHCADVTHSILGHVCLHNTFHYHVTAHTCLHSADVTHSILGHVCLHNTCHMTLFVYTVSPPTHFLHIKEVANSQTFIVLLFCSAIMSSQVQHVLDHVNQSQLGYGAAPPPAVDYSFIPINPSGTKPPGAFVFPAPFKGSIGVAIKRFYFERNPMDLSYDMNDNGLGIIKPSPKDGIVLSIEEAILTYKALATVLERQGVPKEKLI